MSGVYLAFDFGEKRIGVAIGDDLTGSARPLPAVSTGDWKSIEKVVADWRPAAVIVGMPLNDDGSDQLITTLTRKFIRQLEERLKLTIHVSDERFSSRAADNILRDARASGQMTRRVRKGDRDGQAARVILEQWLRERC